MLSINDQIAIPDSELQFTFARSSGQGGQNVNKVSSKAVLHWNVSDTECLPEPVRRRFQSRFRNRISRDGCLVLHGQKYRDQARNMDDCRQRLKTMIQSVLHAPVKRKPTKPSRGAQRRRLKSKKINSEKKQMRRRPPSD